ncbi:unnamed protein product [Heligmosomoides polygyrus]|uniref:C2H2-type domain-containing protein n=1 Tax=Heligmosomoides polygyrus TaxID=6339 RepID=A0A3P8FAL7_HELPZ|nr:unnamed protein product [Heligmosomoides polygyrus]
MHTDNVMYLCQQCVVAFEDPQKARKHLAQHMVKAPAYPCERCSGICLSEANLREHLKKHEDLKLSYRCLKCSPNKIFQTITLQRSLGFAVASEVYYQPADEEQYRKAVASVSDVAKDSFQEERERAWKTSNLLIPLKSIARSPSYNKMPSSHVEKDMGFSHDVEISQSL